MFLEFLPSDRAIPIVVDSGINLKGKFNNGLKVLISRWSWSAPVDRQERERAHKKRKTKTDLRLILTKKRS